MKSVYLVYICRYRQAILSIFNSFVTLCVLSPNYLTDLHLLCFESFRVLFGVRPSSNMRVQQQMLVNGSVYRLDVSHL